MKIAVRTSKIDIIKHQLLTSLEVSAEDIVASPTKYGGITILNIDENAISTLGSMRNIEVLLLDEEAATQLRHPLVASDAVLFKSLDGVGEREQFEHLSQILHIQKATRNKR